MQRKPHAHKIPITDPKSVPGKRSISVNKL